ncbi:MAG TPA: glycosyl hydrolase family 18 protein [Thermoanaerobaculia bacterium]
MPSYAWRTSIWVAPWDKSALPSVQTNIRHVDESNPVWYTLDASGAVTKVWNAENPAWRAAMAGTELIPTIQNYVNGSWNGPLVATLLATADSRERHAEEITRLVVSSAFDGIDIDYESVPAASRADFSAFVRVLGDKLHASRKKLSITVHAKTSDSTTRRGPGAQDWAAIGAVADSMKVMVYNFHWSGSEAGAVTPLSWLDQVATYAREAIPPSKVIIGLPFYGFDWVGTKGTHVTYTSAMALAASKAAKIERDAEGGEAMFRYADHTVYFQDASSYEGKVSLLREKHGDIGGVAHWSAGQEDPATWQIIAAGGRAPDSGNGGSSGATPVTPDFAVSGPALLKATQGRETAATFDLVAINGFDRTAAVTMLPVPGITLTPASVAAGQPAALRFTVARSVAPGTYDLVLRFTSGSLTRDRRVTLQVAGSVARRRSV